MQKIFQKKLEAFIKKNKYKVNIYAVFQRIGYKKHPSIKNKLVIDENVAHIVRNIFYMYANGHGSVEIANYLNNNKYLSPIGYRKTGIIQDETKTGYNWNEVTLCNILKNEVYIGNTIQNKKTVISYKVKKIRNVEKEKQIRVNNTHDPIIDEDVFEKVQCILEKRCSNTKLKYDYLLRDLLYCYHSKRKLQIVLKKSSKQNAKSHPYITCSNYKSKGCYPLNINYEKFERHIIYVIKKILLFYVNKNFLYKIYKDCHNKTFCMKKFVEEKIEKIAKKIFDINDKLYIMYTDKINNILSEEDYIRYSQKIILERTNLLQQKEKLEQKLTAVEEIISIKNQTREEKEFDELIENFLKIEKFDKIYLYRLINKIEIDKEKNVYIYFNFSKLNSINENLNEFIKIENLIS